MALVKRGRKWVGVIPLGKDAAGKKRQRWVTLTATTRPEAEAALARLIVQRHEGTLPQAPAALTVKDFLERWLDHARTAVQATTWARYADIVAGHLVPALGYHRLRKLAPLHVQAAYDAMLRDGRRRGHGGLSPRTVQQAHAILHRALKMAVKWELLGRNVCDAVEPPHPVRKEIHPLDETQTVQLLEAAAGTAWYLPILLAVTTGMRRGELFGLRWTDIDLEAGTVAVRRALVQVRAERSFKLPKNGKAHVVVLPTVAIAALRRHRIEQTKAKLASGAAYTDQGLILSRPDGSPWSLKTFANGFRAWARRHGFAGVRFHDLRHGHATHLLRQGVPLKVVSTRLGHATVAITADIYSHVLKGMDEEAAVKLDAALRAAGLGQDAGNRGGGSA